MPEQVLPSEEDFNRFKDNIIKEGFRPISDPEFTSSFKRLGLEAQRCRKGREIGFSFSANGLTAIIWTTFLGYEKCARDEDSGWALIADGDNVRYYATPLRRTSGFLIRLLLYAKIIKERVQNRPLCPDCKCFTRIVYGKNPKSRCWSCPKCRKYLPWDTGISQELKEFLEKKRKERRRYRESERGEKVVKRAILRRKPWRIGNPQNMT